MKSLLGRSSASPLIVISLIIRMFWGLSIDHPNALNASWMCPIVGFVLFLPFLFALERLRRMGNGSLWDIASRRIPDGLMKIISLLFALMLIYDAAVTARLMGASINFVALNDLSLYLLVLPLGIVAFVVVLLGGDALGSSGRIWLRVLPLFVFIVVAIQFSSYEIGWLAPILGAGVTSILNGSLYCAGCMALISLIWLVAVPDREQKGLFRHMITATICATFIMMTQQMLNPALLNVPLTHSGRIDLVLSNGRIPLSPQMVLDILWYGNLLHLVSTEIVAAAAFIERNFSAIRRWIIASAAALAMMAIATLDEDIVGLSPAIMGAMYLIVGAILIVWMLLILFAKGDSTCEAEKSSG